MQRRLILCNLGIFLALVVPVSAEEPAPSPLVGPSTATMAEPMVPAAGEVCDPAPCCASSPAPQYAPTMFGDIIAILIGIRDGTSNTRAAPISIAYGAVKIAENESPLPQDRC